MNVQINTTDKTGDDAAFDGFPLLEALPAGPSVRVTGDVDIDIAGQMLSGTVAFQQITEDGPDGTPDTLDDVRILTIELTDVSLALGDHDPNDDVPAPVQVSITAGTVRLEPAGIVAASLESRPGGRARTMARSML